MAGKRTNAAVAKQPEVVNEAEKVVKKETKSVVKKVSAKKEELQVSLQLQFAGKSYEQDDFVKMAKDVWTYDLNQKEEDLETIELYVKPEESLVYYVMNKEFAGSFAI